MRLAPPQWRAMLSPNRRAAAAVMKYARRIGPENIEECCMGAGSAVGKLVEKGRLPIEPFLSGKERAQVYEFLCTVHERTHFLFLSECSQLLREDKAFVPPPFALPAAGLAGRSMAGRSKNGESGAYGLSAQEWIDTSILPLMQAVAREVEAHYLPTGRQKALAGAAGWLAGLLRAKGGANAGQKGSAKSGSQDT